MTNTSMGPDPWPMKERGLFAGEEASLGLEGRRLRLQTLLLLRWIAVGGQSITVAWVTLVLGFTLPLPAVLTVIAGAAWANVVFSLQANARQPLSPTEITAQLTFDVFQLTALLMLTGGLANPFVVLLAAPVVIAFTVMRARYALIVAAMCVLATGLMALWSRPLPWYPEGGFSPPGVYLIGLWMAFIVGATFISVFVWRVAEDARRMSAALAATQSILAREQRLSALGGLAAAAAHELGTPLGTIQLVARELENAAGDNEALREDAHLLVVQSQRCRDILSRLSQRGDEGDAVHASLSLRDLLAEVIEPHLNERVHIETVLETADGPVTARIRSPRLQRLPELLYALGNFLANAVDYASDTVVVRGFWDDDQVIVDITDDGPGFAHELLGRLGDPYVSDRDSDRRMTGGLGLGIFIGKLFVERTGGQVEFANRPTPHTGARVRVTWPLMAIRAPAEPPAMQDASAAQP